MNSVLITFALLVLVNKVQITICGSYGSCRLVSDDVLIYHRRIKQDPTRHFKLELVSFPETLIDLQRPSDIKVISCILCKDLHGNSTHPSDSECKILSGGVGYTFVKFAISCLRRRGYDYDIKIYGQ